MPDENNKGFISGMILGSILGTVLGVMIAPESGEKTRQKFQKKIINFKDYLVDEVKGIATSRTQKTSNKKNTSKVGRK